jgi:hypothetical protein
MAAESTVDFTCSTASAIEGWGIAAVVAETAAFVTASGVMATVVVDAGKSDASEVGATREIAATAAVVVSPAVRRLLSSGCSGSSFSLSTSSSASSASFSSDGNDAASISLGPSSRRPAFVTSWDGEDNDVDGSSCSWVDATPSFSSRCIWAGGNAAPAAASSSSRPWSAVRFLLAGLPLPLAAGPAEAASAPAAAGWAPS